MLAILMMSAMSLAFDATVAAEPADGPAPLPPLPTPQQLAWSELETYAFVHFGPNTFTNKEWGEGLESPKVFHPTNLDCRQWARVCQDAGLKAIIITAKHHDGFCLWPSKFTEHSVKSSDWRDGRGDVLRDLADACREFGLKFGVYLSPWDRNNPLYGTGQPYNEYFASQLREVLTGYGDVFEVWFDGACGEGPNGKRQQYDWDLFIRTVRECQPDAVIFSDAGPDVRWVGNEAGYAGETNWSMLRRDEFHPGIPDRTRELNEGHEDGTHWLPAECDVSIRPGWFYHPEQDDKVKGVEKLVDIYLGSVGRNGNLLLNLPVDRRGLVHENDAAALGAWRKKLDAMFADDLARSLPARIEASNVRALDQRWAASNLINGDPASIWATDDLVRAASIELTLASPAMIEFIELREPIALGQRVRRFSIDVIDGRATGDIWRKVAEGTTIGRRRIVRIEPMVASGVRVRVEDARAAPALQSMSLYAPVAAGDSGAQ